MKAIIVDDESLAIEALKILLTQIGGVEIIGTYTNPKEALQAINQFDIDVIFLDIEMGTSHGVDIAKKVQEKHVDTKIVFVTAHAEFAIDAFEIQAYDYLLKPVRKERLLDTLNRIRLALKQVPLEKSGPKLLVNAMDNFKLYKDGQEEIKWRTKKVRELFAYIWHHYPNPVPRSRIMEEIWGEQHGGSAVQLMHTSFYHLRKTIRDSGFPNPVEFVNEQYVLCLETDSDLYELEKVMNASEIGEAEIEKIIDLYQGNYFEEENYQWALPKQQSLKKQFLATLEKFVVEKIESNQLCRLLEVCLEKMVKIDPYNERYIYLSIDYHGKTKNLPEIIRIAGRFEELWTRELGIAIPEEISSLYYKYITRKPEK